MKTLEIQLTERTATKLEQAAERLSLSPEELLVISVEEKLLQLDEEFRSASSEVLQKNADLYKRLA
jgi:hypothetical protein